MKTFLINLDKDVERLAAASSQLNKIGVSFERVSAVVGKELPQEKQMKAYRHFRWWCAMGRPIRLGEIGCALSHYTIYKKMIDEGLDVACILEDDVIIGNGFVEQVEKVVKFVDIVKPQVFLLSNHTNGREVGEGICRSRGDRHAESYIITRPAAIALREENIPMVTPCDFWDRWVKKGIIELFHVFPTVCYPNEEAYSSNTAPSGGYNVKSMSLMVLIFHKIRRALGLIIDFMFLVFKK